MPTNILKTAFTAIIGTLCLILIILTLKVVFGGFDIEKYKSILEILGIPTLIGMVVQSFIHQKPEDVPNDKNQIIKSTDVTVKSPVVSASGSDNSTDVTE